MGEIADDEVHYGMGITGEPGVRIEKDLSAKTISEALTSALAVDLRLSADDEVAVTINGGGNVTVIEELIVCGHVCRYLRDMGVSVFDTDVQERVKVERTNSICVSIMKLDEELKRYLCVEASSPLVFKRRAREA
jgi:dihydroxyacetone kinase